MKIPHELIAGVCAKLIEAPKADAKSVRAAILQMREQLIAAMIEKNWDMRQLREWLAAQGVDVPLESLGRYLQGDPRGAKNRPASSTAWETTSAPR